MKIIGKLFALGFLIISILYQDPCYALRGRESNFREYLQDKRDVKIFIQKITNSCGDSRIKTEELRRFIEEAFSSRRSNTFIIVQKRADADVAVDVDIIEYYWTEEDPIDQITGSVAIAYDAMKKENYARMQASFTLVDVANNRDIWEKIIKATVTDDSMNEEESYDIVNKRITKVFIRNLFKRSPKR